MYDKILIETKVRLKINRKYVHVKLQFKEKLCRIRWTGLIEMDKSEFNDNNHHHHHHEPRFGSDCAGTASAPDEEDEGFWPSHASEFSPR